MRSTRFSRGSSRIGYSRSTMRSAHGPAKVGHYVIVMLALLMALPLTAQQSPTDVSRQNALDLLLDTYVRDGFVYYRALKLERARLDQFVTQLATADVDRLPRDAQMAFWLNAYDALVLRTVIDHYPIQGTSANYPKQSIRQIPGAFDRLPHTVAGRALTLDQIEQSVLAEFHDARVYLAIGRGAIGGGRLRSEAFTADRLETQLTAVAGECVNRAGCLRVDAGANTLSVSPVFSWREKDFVAAYGNAAPAAFAERSPIERAVLAFVGPKLLAAEREALGKNTFRLVYLPFDWSLNDLTGRGGR
jgi:hypothetical protein